MFAIEMHDGEGPPPPPVSKPSPPPVSSPKPPPLSDLTPPVSGRLKPAVGVPNRCRGVAEPAHCGCAGANRAKVRLLSGAFMRVACRDRGETRLLQLFRDVVAAGVQRLAVDRAVGFAAASHSADCRQERTPKSAMRIRDGDSGDGPENLSSRTLPRGVAPPRLHTGTLRSVSVPFGRQPLLHPGPVETSVRPSGRRPPAKTRRGE